jgi:ABC-type glutathione transport system ATPase component
LTRAGSLTVTKSIVFQSKRSRPLGYSRAASLVPPGTLLSSRNRGGGRDDRERQGGAPSGDVSVRLDGVSKHFGAFVAVDAVDLDVGRGEFFSLLGPSGWGKTTCLRMIAGFERPTSGRVSWAGRT